MMLQISMSRHFFRLVRFVQHICVYQFGTFLTAFDFHNKPPRHVNHLCKSMI